MRWLRGSPEPSYRRKHNRRLEEAERHLADLIERAERVAPALQGRMRRNHWGETVAAIARRESP